MKTNAKQNQARGGARPGAGRKRTRGKTYGFKATPEVEALLESCEGSKSDVINRAILAYFDPLTFSRT